MTQRWLSRIAGLLRSLAGRSLASCPLSRAPHSLQLYEDLIAQWKAKGADFITVQEFILHSADLDKPHVVLRHDVDTVACVRQSPGVATREEAIGVRSSWYIRVDEFQYRVRDAAPLVEMLRARGHHVGLHAAPYIHEEPLAALKRCIQLFESAFGFAPATFTVHGFPASALLQERRQAFLVQLAATKVSFPLCDTLPGIAYDQCVGDARFTADRGQAYLDRLDWWEAQRVRPGKALLVLTHPCYWGDGGLRTAPWEF